MLSSNKSFHHEIAETLSNDIDREVLDQTIVLLSAQKPKISINTTFRDRLRNTILNEKKETPSHFSFERFFSFSFVSVIWAIGACCIAVFSFWDIFSTLLSSPSTPPALLHHEGESSRKENPSIASWLSLWQEAPLVPSVSKAFNQKLYQEQISIHAEIEDIVHDLTDIDSILDEDSSHINVQKKLQTNPMERSIPTSDIVTSVPMLRSMDSDGTMGMEGPLAIGLRHTSSLDISIPPYPEYMPIYKKQGSAFTPEEIRDKSGSGIMMFEWATESNQSMIELKVYKQLENTIVSEEPTVSYRSMRKKWENKMNFYLVPNLRYLDQSGRSFYVPLMRGFE